MIYGGSAAKCASMLGVPAKDGKKLFNYFWEYNSGLKILKEKLGKMYKANGYIVGLDGRKLFIRAEYKLLNSLFQSAAALIYKKWTVLAYHALKDLDIEQMIMLHDENQYRCHRDCVEEAIPLIESICLEAGEYFNIRVPVTASCDVGMNWFDTHD